MPLERKSAGANSAAKTRWFGKSADATIAQNKIETMTLIRRIQYVWKRVDF